MATEDEPSAGDDVDEPNDDTDQAGTGTKSRRSGGLRSLDARTLAVCVLVAFVAAALTYVVVGAVVGDDDQEHRGRLVAAERIPDVDLERLDGTPVTTGDFLGAPLVVNFWGAWCAPCVEEMPDFQAVHQSLGDDVNFLGINVRDQVPAAEEMLERTGVTYDIARDTKGELGRALGITTFPSTVLVDEKGVVIDVVHGKISRERLCEKINQQLLNLSLQECG